MSVKELLFSAKGRIGRKDFWFATIALGVAATPFRLLGPIGGLMDLVFIYPHICLFAKRSHDAGKSGWLAAAVYVPPGLAVFIAALTAGAGGNFPVWSSVVLGCVIIACVGFYLRIGFAKSVPAADRGAGTTAVAEVFS